MRTKYIDNLKGILICLVVWAHFIELILPHGKWLYTAIYFFHMPAFIFCTGYFSSFNFKKILSGLVVPYIILQLVFIFFENLFFDAGRVYQFYTPHWLLWYIFAVMVWRFLIPVFNRKNRITRIIIFALAVVIALVSGFWENAGYKYSLSRILVYTPFFLFGYYGRKEGIEKIREIKWVKYLALVIFISFIIYIEFVAKNFHTKWLYSAYPFSQAGYNIGIRFQILLWGFLMTLSLFAIIPDKESFITKLGKNSGNIYYLHGFLVRALFYTEFFEKISFDFAIATVFALAEILIFSGNYITKPLNFIISGQVFIFLGKLPEKMLKKYQKL